MPIDLAAIGGQASAPPQAPTEPEKGPVDLTKINPEVPAEPLLDRVESGLKDVGQKLSKVPGTTRKLLETALGQQKQNFAPVGMAAAPVSQMAHQSITDLQAWADEYSEKLKEDNKYEPQGLGDDALHGLKTANDVLGLISGPVMSPVYTSVIRPLQQATSDLGNLAKKYAAEDAISAQERRMAWIEGRQARPDVVKGPDLKIRKRDVDSAVAALQTATEAAVNAGLLVAGGEKTPERAPAVARKALADVTASVEPKAPEIKPIAVSLDHTMGFKDVRIKVDPALQMTPSGSTRTVASLLDDMIPNTTGYAKSFLEKLNQHIDPTIPVMFKQALGLAARKDTVGQYLPDLHQIHLKTGEGDMAQTAIHEMVHATTIHMLNDLATSEVARLPESASQIEKLNAIRRPQSPILRELDMVLHEARVRASKAGRKFYGLGKSTSQDLAFNAMSPRYEFLAELFSNHNLQEFLANSEKYASVGYKAKDLFNQFTNLIARHLGLVPGEQHLLARAMKVGTGLIEMQSAVKPPQRGIGSTIIGAARDGSPITRGDLDYATTPIGRVRDVKAVRRTTNALAVSIEGMLRAIAPEALTKSAKLTGSIIAGRLAELAQATSAWHHGAQTRLNFWRSRPELVRGFIEKFEKGGKFDDPELQKLADHYREWNTRIFEQDKVLGIEYEPRDNYLSHIFDDPEGVADYFTRKYGTKWGDPKFTKDRAFDLYKEAVAAGFVPKFDNPEDIMLARQQASDLASATTGILKDLRDHGLATLKTKAETKLELTPDAGGKMKMEVKETKANKQPEDTTRWRAPNGDVYWVSNEALPVLENRFLSKSLWSARGVGGLAFRGAMALKNSIVPIRLAFSLFHPLHVTGIDIAAGWTRAATGLLSGTTDPLSFLGEITRSGFGPLYENPKMGWRTLQVWRGKIPKEMLNDSDTQALQTLFEGGMTPEMSSQYRTNARKNFMNAVRDTIAGGRLMRPGLAASGAARATWHAPWALISALQKPIFEEWIPMLKTASYLKDAQALLARQPELLENEAERITQLRRLAKSVDNRYGEMAYDTLFWKRWIKDLAVLNTLSLGWQLGFMREYGGGLLDTGRFITQGSGRLERIKAGQLDKPLFVVGYTTLGAATAGLMTYAMTGQYPTGMDWINPRVGGDNPDGTPKRVTTMFYSREFASLGKHIQHEGVAKGISDAVMNKGSGVMSLVYQWGTGMNSFNEHYRNPDDPVFQQLEQTLAYTMIDAEPITMKGLQQAVGTEEEQKQQKMLTVFGFNPEPKYMRESMTQSTIEQAYDQYVRPSQTPFETAEYSKEYRTLRDAYRSGDPKTGDLLEALTEKYQLSGKDQRRMMKILNSDLTPTQRMFMRLPWAEQKKVLDKATPEERDSLLPHSNKEHLRNQYEPPEP